MQFVIDIESVDIPSSGSGSARAASRLYHHKIISNFTIKLYQISS